MKMDEPNKLVIIGNGFDLAHGLKTSYEDFINWYFSIAFETFCLGRDYSDPLIRIWNQFPHRRMNLTPIPKTLDAIQEIRQLYPNIRLEYNGAFFPKLVESFQNKKWVDIECYYFKFLKSRLNKPDQIVNLNNQFSFLLERLGKYMEEVNRDTKSIQKLNSDNSYSNFDMVFAQSARDVRVVNFNYTETLIAKSYARPEEIIHIHGRVSEIETNPIIFGYGDETDPIYQDIEDSGENIYLEHIKSFGYFKTDNYTRLLSYIDSAPFSTYIIGHSCGLSDRVLLNGIFEHQNCQKIEIFYHVRENGKDNFKEITQEISRHFRPQNKGMMRRRINYKNPRNIIPQNIGPK